MLYWFFQQASEYYSAFGVFQYITLRTVISALTALLISLLL